MVRLVSRRRQLVRLVEVDATSAYFANVTVRRLVTSGVLCRVIIWSRMVADVLSALPGLAGQSQAACRPPTPPTLTSWCWMRANATSAYFAEANIWRRVLTGARFASLFEATVVTRDEG